MSRKTSSSAMDKYLKETYTLLNMGCNKKALQEVDKLPKKFRDLKVFRALKSLALIRMSKRRQAFEILNEINLDDNDIDDATLQAMTSCYKESVDVARIVALYEAAAKRKPNDLEIMIHLFMAHVRVFNFKRQKEIAMQLYKNFSKKKRLYSFWTIMSLVMQSAPNTIDSSTTEKKVCLDLAEKMCEKMIDEERTHEEVELYLSILRKQGKHEEEYRLLSGPMFSRFPDNLSWFNRRRAYLCLDLKMYSRAFKHYFPNLIEEYPDQLEYYQGLFKSALLLDTEAPTQQQLVIAMPNSDQQPVQQTAIQPPAGTPVKSTSALAECIDIVERQCNLSTPNNSEPHNKEQQKAKPQSNSKNLSRTSSLNQNKGRPLRGPYMARIALLHTIENNKQNLPKNIFNLCKSLFHGNHLSSQADLEVQDDAVYALIVDYFKLFCRKVICYSDMEHLISKYAPNDTERITKMTANWTEQLKQQDMSEIDYFYTIMNYHMVNNCIRNYLRTESKELRLTRCKKYIDLYDKYRHLGKNSNKTEFLPVDNYCLLAVNSIMTNSSKIGKESELVDDSTVVTLIALCENAIFNSPNNHQIKLLLLKLYSFIGVSKQCSSVLLFLDIKHFQIDTLGHLLNPVLYNTGLYTLSKESLDTCLEFYAHGIRECFEALTTSYVDAKFSKIEEISNVLQRLRDSLNEIQCALLKEILNLTTASTLEDLSTASQSFDSFTTLHSIFEKPEYSSAIKDNRDFRVLKSLNLNTDKHILERKLETAEDDKLWSKLRYYLLKSVYTQLEQAKSRNSPSLPNETNFEAELDNCKKVLQELIEELEQVRQKQDPDNQEYSFLEAESSPIKWKQIEVSSLTSLIKTIVTTPIGMEFDTEIQADFEKVFEKVFAKLEDQLISINSFRTMKQTLLSLTVSIEFVSIAIASLSLAAHGVNSPLNKNNSTKANKIPSNQKNPLNKTKSSSGVMLNKIESQITKLLNVIKNIDVNSAIMDKITGFEKQLLSNEGQKSIETKSGYSIIPILPPEVQQTSLARVKDRLLDSYIESLKEIETVCRAKLDLCRNKNS